MRKCESPGMQPQSGFTGAVGKSAVLRLVSVLGVPDDGVPEMPHVQSNLVVSTRMGRASEQAEPRRGITRDRVRQFTPFQNVKRSAGDFRGACHPLGQRFAYAARMVNMPAHHTDIFLEGFPRFKLPFTCIDGGGILAKQDDAAGRLVQSVHGIETTGSTFPKDVLQILFFMGINGRSMHQKTGRFGYGEVPLVLEKQPNLTAAR
jgi:hypothetical protein